MIALWKRLEANDALYGVLCVLLATLGLSTKAIFIKLVYELDPEIDAASILGMRFLIALPFFLLLLVTYPSGNLSRPPLKMATAMQFIMLGIGGFYLSAVLDFAALATISAGLERLILFLYPTFVVLFSLFLRPAEVNRQTIIALMISYLGIVIVFAGYSGAIDAAMIRGSLMVLAAAVIFAMYTIGSVGPIRKFGSIRFTVYVITVATISAVLHAGYLHGLAAMNRSPDVYFLMLPMAIFSTFLPLLLMAEGVKRIGASNASVVSMSGPVFTLLLAWWLLAETYGWLQIAGGVMIMYGVYLTARSGR